MVNSYLHRIEAVEERLGIRGCPEGALCFRCGMAQLHAELHGETWAGCDGKPSSFRFVDLPNASEDDIQRAIANLTFAELDQHIANLRILIARHPDNAKLSNET
jgi:hypothetical protein